MELTSVGPGGPIIITFDRPFLFAITENSSNSIVFIGKVAEPSVPVPFASSAVASFTGKMASGLRTKAPSSATQLKRPKAHSSNTVFSLIVKVTVNSAVPRLAQEMLAGFTQHAV